MKTTHIETRGIGTNQYKHQPVRKVALKKRIARALKRNLKQAFRVLTYPFVVAWRKFKAFWLQRVRLWTAFKWISVFLAFGAIAPFISVKINFHEAKVNAASYANVVHREPEPVKPEPSMKEYVLGEVEKAGLSKDEADKIIQCESGWDPQEINTRLNKDGTWDGGLWMINSVHKNITTGDRFDYKKATAWAIEKRLQKGKWSPTWSCATLLGIK